VKQQVGGERERERESFQQGHYNTIRGLVSGGRSLKHPRQGRIDEEFFKSKVDVCDKTPWQAYAR
jgi:hypothetical protein